MSLPVKVSGCGVSSSFSECILLRMIRCYVFVSYSMIEALLDSPIRPLICSYGVANAKLTSAGGPAGGSFSVESKPTAIVKSPSTAGPAELLAPHSSYTDSEIERLYERLYETDS